MTMHTKICFLFVALLLIIIQSKCMGSDEKNADTSASKSKPESTGTNENQLSKQPQKSGSSSAGNRPQSHKVSYEFETEPEMIILEPVSHPSANQNQLNLKQPVCHSLVDAQYSIFSDMCGTLPQIRYSLPNKFGHLHRWQIVQVLNSFLASSTVTSNDPTCNRSLRMLICPLLFPPCRTSHETTVIVPCQPFCRAVKSQCVAPLLDLLPCDFLPLTSELCPINPTRVNPLFAAYNQQAGIAGLSSMQQPTAQNYLSLQPMLSLASSQAGSSPLELTLAGIPQTAISGESLPLQRFLYSTAGSQGVYGLPMKTNLVQQMSLARLLGMHPSLQKQMNTQTMIDTTRPVLIDFPYISKDKLAEN